MSNSTDLENSTYNILKALGREADFLYDTIDTYTADAKKSSRNDLVSMWEEIKTDRLRHLHMLKEALEKEIHK
jgi:rubrerythrin